MNVLDIQVLRHWGNNIKKAYKGELELEDILGENCYYCQYYQTFCTLNNKCCPIFNYTREVGCKGTPWTKVKESLKERHSYSTWKDIYQNVKNEFKFLTKVIKAKEDKNK